jgi:hypothetical protein
LNGRLERSSIDLALIGNTSGEAMRTDLIPTLKASATWFQNQRATLWDMPAVVHWRMIDQTVRGT